MEEVRIQKAKYRRFMSVFSHSVSWLLYSVFLLLLLFPPSVLAHARSTSYSTWEIHGNRAQVTVYVPAIELQRLGSSPALPSADVQQRDGKAEWRIATYLTRHIQLFANHQPCTPVLPSVRILPSSDNGRFTQTWELACPPSQRFRLRADAFFAAAPAHLHFARVRVGASPGIEKIFSVYDREWFLFSSEAAAGESSSRFLDYLRLGVTHILSGADHLVFLLALLLVTESMISVAQVVTGFTVAHSVTLALSVFNLVRPLPVAIEALIGFSIGIVALENFFMTTGEETQRRLVRVLMISLFVCVVAAGIGGLHVPFLALLGMSIFSVAYLRLLRGHTAGQNLRWFVAFIFGLIHGFGFAGALSDLALPANRLAIALWGFNCGVELGQLAVVILLWPWLTYMRQSVGVRTRVLTIQTGSAGILALGIFWFVTRAVGR